MARVVFVEGNIGAGKSTLLDALADTGCAEVHKEPLERWAGALRVVHEMDAAPPERRHPHGYVLQGAVLDWYEELLPRIAEGGSGLHVVERSPQSVVDVFGKYWEGRGLLTPSQMRHLEMRTRHLMESVKALETATVFLDAPDDACATRASWRGDPEPVAAQARAIGQTYRDLAAARGWHFLPDADADTQVVAFMAAVAV